MRNVLCVQSACIFLAACVLGCGPSLKEYVAKSANYQSQTRAATAVSVDIESRPVMRGGRGTFGAIASTVNLASSIGSAVLSSEQQKRLQQIVHASDMSANIAYGFDSNFAQTTHLTAVADGEQPDLRIMLKVSDYGLHSESLTAPMHFYVEAEIQVVYAPELKTIYTNGVSISREVSNVLSEMAKAAENPARILAVAGPGFSRASQNKAAAIGAVGNLVSGAANLAALFELTDEDIANIFAYMAVDAGGVIAGDLVGRIYG